MSIALALPEVTFRSLPEQQHLQRAEPTEAWMNDTGELLNRMAVSFFRGTVDDGMQRRFRQPGQDAARWTSTDWAVQFVGTSWIDYKSAEGQTGDAPQTTRLWKSVDGGRTWTRLPWPERQDIDRLLFVDPQRGYAAGGGPRVWRTDDALAREWSEPSAAAAALKARQSFNTEMKAPDIGFAYGPVRGCSDSKDRYQVELDLTGKTGETVAKRCALIRQERNGFTMLGFRNAAEPACRGANLMPQH
ncbi:hypothetical protein FEQ05_02609 [Burkholderia pseudomultivorans]|uniref:Glycosyl hydrolase n=2 Tax=Burkholderia pseudomultivorans TaxID=1207504 RepID=A0ABU2E4D1_9BURK|nr:hypothetical protein [Burkholderia pseudomultivorans]MDR8733216.1 hypothetical protein [Burkholderia pseudomultivorans]MDR8742839.1 hypothetical protein [Burkholderia pseudomultivorans]MDR8754721.1 hypothetical protein [Burkholderia pseudomultivorans]MDR8776189.1 hypothetical protein [Burkholderia pseudomultivorans]